MLIQGLKLLPKSAVSYVTGVLARLRLPYPLSLCATWLFAKVFRLDLGEAELPLPEYRTIEDLFTRRLRPGAREIKDEILCSPADGTLVCAAPAAAGRAVQIKGLDYGLDDLVFGEPRSELKDDLAWYTTIYLAPHNYHRCHYPITGTMSGIRYIPGTLWPVNQLAVACIPQLFVHNERLVFELSTAAGAKVYAVMVGALNVGRIQPTARPEFATNSALFRGSRANEMIIFERPLAIRAGEEMGTFMLGSTVVLVMDKQAVLALGPMQTQVNQPILMGQSLRAGLNA